MKQLILSIVILISLSLSAQNQPDIKLYPNPASTFIRVTFSEPIQTDITLTISDILGNKIETVVYKASESIYLDLSNLNLLTGMYLIKIETGKQIYLKRLSVKTD